MSTDEPGDQDLKTRFEELITFITEANEQVQSDNVVQLGDLDAKVTELCKEAEGEGPEALAEIQPLMANMISKLDELATNLSAYKERQNKEE